MPDPRELLHSNLHEVFSERHPERRWTAIDRTYTEDVRFIDPEGNVCRATRVERPGSEATRWGNEGLRVGGGRTTIRRNRHRRAGVAFRPPPGHPVARGIDILTIRHGRVSVVRTLIASHMDA